MIVATVRPPNRPVRVKSVPPARSARWSSSSHRAQGIVHGITQRERRARRPCGVRGSDGQRSTGHRQMALHERGPERGYVLYAEVAQISLCGGGETQRSLGSSGAGGGHGHALELVAGFDLVTGLPGSLEAEPVSALGLLDVSLDHGAVAEEVMREVLRPPIAELL